MQQFLVTVIEKQTFRVKVQGDSLAAAHDAAIQAVKNRADGIDLIGVTITPMGSSPVPSGK